MSTARKDVEERLAFELADAPLASEVTASLDGAFIELLAGDAAATAPLLSFRPSTVADVRIDTLWILAFGNRLAESGDGLDPGPINEELAHQAAAFVARRPVPIIAQWEVAEVLAALGIADVISVEPDFADDGSVIYLSTEGVLEKGLLLTAPAGVDVGQAGVLAHADHAVRCLLTATAVGMDAAVPQSARLPTGYDDESAQPWTTDRGSFIPVDLMARTMLDAPTMPNVLTCRGVVFPGDGTYETREFPVPEPGPRGAVLKVEAVGLCASDVSQLHGHKHVPGEVSPVVPGHEIVGRVHALGPDADFGVEVGQQVGVDLVLMGGRDGTGLDVYGYTIGPDVDHGLWGGYGEYMGVLPGTHLVPLTDDVPAAELSLFEPLASIVHWSELLGLHERDRLVIQGPGHMGLIAAAYAASQIGVRQIIVTGTSADGLRLDAALAVGAHEVINVDEEDDLVGRIQALTRGGPTAVMELTAMATKPVSDAIEMANFGGRILLAGLKDERPVEIVSDHIVMKSLRVIAGSGSTPDTMDKAGEVLNSGTFPTAALLGETYTLDQLDEALQMLERKIPGRDAARVSLVHA